MPKAAAVAGQAAPADHASEGHDAVSRVAAAVVAVCASAIILRGEQRAATVTPGKRGRRIDLYGVREDHQAR